MNARIRPAAVPVVVQAAEPGQTIELIRGSEQPLLVRLRPLVHQFSVRLDMSPVERIDAAGLAALIALYRGAEEAGHSFAVFNPRPHVLEILGLVGLDRVLLSPAADPASQYEVACAQTAA